jgi:hypothetical protein
MKGAKLPVKALVRKQMKTRSTAWRHADELVSRLEAYPDVRRNKPAPCFDTGKDEENATDGRFSTACQGV